MRILCLRFYCFRGVGTTGAGRRDPEDRRLHQQGRQHGRPGAGGLPWRRQERPHGLRCQAPRRQR